MFRGTRLLLAMLVGASGAVLPGWPATAQLPDGFEQIRDYDVELLVEPDGDLVVTETIEYDFGNQSKRGIYRDIPVRFHFDGEHDRVYPLEDIRVSTSTDAPDDLDVSDIGGGRTRLRIGKEDVFITGAHTYTIEYRVEGAIDRFSDHDELFWNAIGVEWATVIARASVRVQGPAPISRVACFAGPEGSRLPCAAARADGTTATFSNGQLSAFEGLTVVAALPPGTVTDAGPILVERRTWNKAFQRTRVTVGGSALLLALGLLGVARLVWRTGRDRRFLGQVPGLEPTPGVDAPEGALPAFADPAGPIEYAPPKGMTPALMGVLIDETAHPLDVTASIVDLAVRRHLRIDELPRKGLFRRRDWQLTRLVPAPDDPLLPWEASLLSALFKTSSPVQLSALKNSFYTDLASLKSSLYDDVVRQGWFTTRPDKVRTIWQMVGVGAVALGAGLTWFLAWFFKLGLLGLPFVVSGLVLLAMSRHMPARTARGSAALARALGFRRYLATAETDQLRFEEQEGIFARYLPYAIVLGQVDRWAKAFEGLGARSQQELYWYSGPSGWHTEDFSDSMSAFAASTAGTIASTPGSSGGSGFGGGGSSGGGGGGGGGGSW